MDNSVKLVFVTLGVIAVAIFAICYSMASKFGMDVQILFGAVISIAFISAISIWIAFSGGLTMAGCFWVPCTFISICPVLRDIATNEAVGPFTWIRTEDLPWYGSTWFLWTGSLLLLGGSALIVHRRWRYF